MFKRTTFIIYVFTLCIFSSSFDLRSGEPNHWTDNHVLNGRAKFRLLGGGAGGRLSMLKIIGVHSSDEGEYRCRVDFKSAPTRNSIAKLTVIVPPSEPVILDGASGKKPAGGYIGPYPEDSDVEVLCHVKEGERERAKKTSTTHFLSSSSLLSFSGSSAV